MKKLFTILIFTSLHLFAIAQYVVNDNVIDSYLGYIQELSPDTFKKLSNKDAKIDVLCGIC